MSQVNSVFWRWKWIREMLKMTETGNDEAGWSQKTGSHTHMKKIPNFLTCIQAHTRALIVLHCRHVHGWNFPSKRVLKMCFQYTFDACVQGLSLSHIIIASASCCFSSLLWPAPVRLLNRVSLPLKTWATLVPPSKTLRGTTQLLFIHSALKTRSDPLTPPYLNTASSSSDH